MLPDHSDGPGESVLTETMFSPNALVNNKMFDATASLVGFSLL